MTYSEKLKDPRWIELADSVKEMHGHRCDGCGDMGTGVQLHAHHKRYYKGLEPWEYDPVDIAVLCKDCHESFHANKDRFENLMTNHILYYSWEMEQAYNIMEYVLNHVPSHLYKRVYETIVDNFEESTF